MLVNKSKKDRIQILNEIKQSTRAFDIHQYFLSIDTSKNRYFSKLRTFVDNVAQKRSKVDEAKDEMIKTMNQVIVEKSDKSMLYRWLMLITKPNDNDKREDVEKQCNDLIDRTKNEEKSNIYIAVALGVVLIIILI